MEINGLSESDMKTKEALFRFSRAEEYFGIENRMDRDVKSLDVTINDYVFKKFGSMKIGDYKFYGRGTEAQDYESAYKYYKAAADEYNPRACFKVGIMSQLGLGVAQNFTNALRYYDMIDNLWIRYPLMGFASLHSALAAWLSNVSSLFECAIVYLNKVADVMAKFDTVEDRFSFSFIR